jgi:hypothetical protein
MPMHAAIRWRCLVVNYLSDANLRAVLTVLVARAGGEVHLTNDELYEAMMPASGLVERFAIESIPDGVCISIKDSYHSELRTGNQSDGGPSARGQ